MTEPVLDAMVLLDDGDRTEENLRLPDLVERATPEELERALGVLSGRAASGGPSDVHLLAVGLGDEALLAFVVAAQARVWCRLRHRDWSTPTERTSTREPSSQMAGCRHGAR
jgi:hypothetical protein